MPAQAAAAQNIGGRTYDISLGRGFENNDFLVDTPLRENMLARSELLLSTQLRAQRVVGHNLVCLLPSLLPGVEVGVFAYSPIKANWLVCAYTGKRTTAPPVGSPVVFEAIKDRLWIVGDPESSFGPSINHHSDERRVNCKIVFRTYKATVRTTRAIIPGEELLAFYGLDYWAVFGSRLPPDEQIELQTRGQARHDRARRLPLATSSDLSQSSPLCTPIIPAQPSARRRGVLLPHRHSSATATPAAAPPIPRLINTVHPTNLYNSRSLGSTSHNRQTWEGEADLHNIEDMEDDGASDDNTLSTGHHPRIPPPPPAALAASAEAVHWLEAAGLFDLATWFSSAFPEVACNSVSAFTLMMEAFQLGSSVFGEDEANTWAEQFSIPISSITADQAIFVACGGNFEQMVKEKRKLVDPLRLSKLRILDYLSPQNPEVSKALDLAEVGIDLCTPPTYAGVTFSSRPALGRAFQATSPAVERMMFDTYWNRGLAIILTGAEVRKLPSLGLCIAGWTTKLNKRCGRPLTNGSGRPTMAPSEYINGPQTKEIAIKRYGSISLPTIGDAVRLVLDFADAHSLQLKELTIWKFDLKAAYTMLSYNTAQVSHVGVELRDETFMFFLGGVFGLTSMPFAFNVITRAIVWELNHGILKGRAVMFVDDGLVVSRRVDELQDIHATRLFLKGLLGPDAVAEDKLIRAMDLDHCLDFIGYNLCLRSKLVTVARHNILRALYAFGSVDVSHQTTITVKELQRLASLGSRYGGICRLMRPFVRVLYSAYRGRHGSAVVTLDNLTKRVITFFKVLLILTYYEPIRFARPLTSFTMIQPTWVCEFDACLSGIGIIWLKRLQDGSERAVAYTSIDITPLGFGKESTYQNTAEYLASLFCIMGLVQLTKASEPCLFRGDSLSALTWIDKGSVRSDIAIRTSLLWAQVVVYLGVQVTGTQWIAGKVNSRTDRLSRNGTWADVLADDARIYHRCSLPATLPFLTLDSASVLDLCNPAHPLDSEQDFVAFLRAGRDLVLLQPPKSSSPRQASPEDYL